VSLTIHTDIEQGTPEWDAARRGILTASVIGQFITPKTVKVAANDKTRAKAYELLAERITGISEDRYVSRDMEEGHFIEPIARDLYSQHYAPATEVGFMVRDDWGFRIGYSPDGVVGDDGLIEIKKRLPKLHLETILTDQMPPEHMAQVQTGLLVSGRQWLDFISYCGGMPLYVKRIHPDPVWHAAIIEAATAFEESANDMISRYTVATADLHPTERIDFYADMELSL